MQNAHGGHDLENFRISMITVYRTVPLPPGVDSDMAGASFKNGVLTVKVPKTEEAQAKLKRIEVKPAYVCREGKGSPSPLVRHAQTE
ncbi:Hsp20/alpha crystallin family protein [Tropicimonas sp. IMCC6043]|uniref:Hsp20/alpha crystallin family protein n=1 Tax=Tropicimonas sp. IMCC6043 TaxID=2510645 RepID=UPI00101E0381|nr:Hsp20 family protein [Tropicimonas sp. IMCC6043]RYH06040.1 Hsp20/alpha crystallin family protein [Tropicimonas sp. IMCC6043]